MRRRAFFLGQRQEDFDRTGLELNFPVATHRPYPLTHAALNGRADWLPSDAGYWPTVREAIADLPAGFESDDFDHESIRYPEAHLTGLRRFLRTTDGSVPYNHIARALGRSGLQKIQALGPGERANALPDELKVKSHYHYSYSRLQWAEPARTITKFAYHVGSGMFTHPVEDRAITMREAARLQSFPDSFRFYADQIRELSALVGSAVPPLLAQRIGQQIVSYLDRLTLNSLPLAERAAVRTQASDAVLKRLERQSWSSSDETQLSLLAEEVEVVGVDETTGE
jgi:DNA (cytosine-5)-methyltransferase 1